MLLDGLGWSHYSVFAPCIMTQTRVLGRSGGWILRGRNTTKRRSAQQEVRIVVKWFS